MDDKSFSFGSSNTYNFMMTNTPSIKPHSRTGSSAVPRPTALFFRQHSFVTHARENKPMGKNIFIIRIVHQDAIASQRGLS